MTIWANPRWASLGMLPQFQLGKFENPCKLHPPVECCILSLRSSDPIPHKLDACSRDSNWDSRAPLKVSSANTTAVLVKRHSKPLKTFITPLHKPSTHDHHDSCTLSENILLTDSICPPNRSNFRGLWKSKNWTWKSWPIDIAPFDPPVPPKEIVGCLWSYFTWKALRALCCGIQTRSALNIMVIGEIHDLPPGYWIPTQGGTCFWTKEKQKRCSFVRNPCPAWPAHGPSKMQRRLRAWGKQAVSRQWIWTKMLKTLRKDKQTC
jgi:hypothetical protein